MTTTPRGAPELASGQAVPETTVNEAVRFTEAGACMFVVADNDLTAPPGSCADGACYIIAATATGAWTGKEKQIATAVGTNAASGWLYHVPVEGFFAWIQDENVLHVYDGSAWGAFTGGSSYTDEQARDAIGTALVAGSNITITVNDGADTITIAATASGAAASFDPLAYHRVCSLVPMANSTVFTASPGYNATSTGTVAKGRTNTNLMSSLTRIGFTTSAAANNHAYTRSSSDTVWRGDAAGRGGFKFKGMIGIETQVATGKALFGLGPNSNGSATDEPSARLDGVGIGWDSTDTTLQVMHNDGTGTATKINLGANFPISADAVYDLELDCAPNGSSISYTVTRLDSAFTASGTISTDLPTSTVFMVPRCWTGNGSTASVQSICCMGFTVYDKNGVT